MSVLHAPCGVLVLLVRLAVRLGALARGKALLEVVDDVVDVLGADADPDQVLCYAGINSLLFLKLLMCGGPGVDGESFRVADTVG